MFNSSWLLNRFQFDSQKIGSFQRITVATPEYLARHGKSNSLNDLKSHNCIIFSLLTTRNDWQFNGPNGVDSVRVQGGLTVNNPRAMRDAVLEHIGIAVIPIWLIDDHLKKKGKSGRYSASTHQNLLKYMFYIHSASLFRKK